MEGLCGVLVCPLLVLAVPVEGPTCIDALRRSSRRPRRNQPATFYAHAVSAVGFLQAFMALRLRERVLAVDAISAQPSLRTFVTPVVAHIERYRAVYQTAFSDPAARASLADGVCLQLRVKLLESRLEIAPDQAAVISSTITQAIFVELETERPLSVNPIITMLASAKYVVNQLL